MSTIGKRLAEERKRLGMNQTEFAAAGGAKRASQVNYETNKRYPCADYLAALAAHGVDVTYVLTGRRCGVDPQPLDEGERQWLEWYRALNPQDRAAILPVVRALAKAEEKGA